MVKLGFTRVYIFLIITFFHLKIDIFTAVKYLCILHGHVFVMYGKQYSQYSYLPDSLNAMKVVQFQFRRKKQQECLSCVCSRDRTIVFTIYIRLITQNDVAGG